MYQVTVIMLWYSTDKLGVEVLEMSTSLFERSPNKQAYTLSSFCL